MSSRCLWSLAALAAFASGAMAQAPPATTRAAERGGKQEADFRAPLPPLIPWSGRSEQLAAAPGDPWATPAEASGLKRSPGYDETVAWLRKLTAAAPQLEMVSLGRSAEGRDVWMVVASEEGAAAPAALKANGKPTLLVQAGIHSGEIDGKDAGMMLLREMTVGGSEKALLERANFLFVPIFSVDGHERASRWSRINQRGPEVMGWRTNARNLNLNRDYAKLDTPEMRAMVAALDGWPVDLYIDVHVTDGADYQYDVTFGWNGPHAHSPAIARWLDRNLRPALDEQLTSWGHVPGPLIFLADRKDPRKGIVGWTAGPRFSTGYGGLRHLPTVLVENHSLKPFRRRVLGTYVLLAETMRLLGEQGASLRQATEQDQGLRPDPVALTWKMPGTKPPTMEFKGIAFHVELSPITGSLVVRWEGRPLNLSVPRLVASAPAATVARPVAYWIPPAWPEVIERLKIHGIEVERITASRKVPVQLYRLEKATLAETAYEGHVRLSAEAKPFEAEWTFPAGSVRVPTDQALGDLAVLLLEPASPDSFFQWGFFLEPLQRTEYAESYAMEPLARRMLERDPELRQRFYDKLAHDAEFRGDPGARLEWFYRQTPYYDQRYLIYPVGRELEGAASR